MHRFAIHYAYDADGLPTVVSDGASAVSNGWGAAVLCAYGIGRAQHRLPSCASQTPFVRTSGFSRAHENWVSCLASLVIGWSSALEHGKPAALTVIG